MVIKHVNKKHFIHQPLILSMLYHLTTRYESELVKDNKQIVFKWEPKITDDLPVFLYAHAKLSIEKKNEFMTNQPS